MFKRAWSKVRHGLVFQELLDGLERRGIRIRLNYLNLEGNFTVENSQGDSGEDEYEAGFLDYSDLRALAGVPERSRREGDLQKWMRGGMKCFAVKKDGRIISYVWCNFTWCETAGLRFQLRPDEAYLFDSFTIRFHRGKGVASLARRRLYKKLLELNRTRVYSVTSYFNRSSKRLKAKLGSKPLELFVSIGLFNRWEMTRTVRTFGEWNRAPDQGS